jgi:acyl carrier protein
MSADESIAAVVKQYILDEFLPGENPDELAADTPLITTGILDSVGTLKLVAFLEERFNIGLAAHEADVEYLNTIGDIVKLVESKQKGR